MPNIIPADNARQGHRGRHLLIILILALLLTAIVWLGVELYGTIIAHGIPVVAMIPPTRFVSG